MLNLMFISVWLNEHPQPLSRGEFQLTDTSDFSLGDYACLLVLSMWHGSPLLRGEDRPKEVRGVYT